MLLPLWLHSMTAAFVIGLRTSLAADVFPLGAVHHYRLQSTTLLDELHAAGRGGGGGAPTWVGFRLTCDVRITALWTDGAESKLLRVHATDWRLHARGQPQGQQGAADFAELPSRLEGGATQPFYAQWRAGRIDVVLMPQADTDVDVKALKRGIASLLQFQLSARETHELDVSGSCHASYVAAGPAPGVITKEKRCEATKPRAGGMRAVGVRSTQRTVYSLAPEKGDYVKIASIAANEAHTLDLAAYDAVGGRVELEQLLTLAGVEQRDAATINAESMEAAVQALLQDEELVIEALDGGSHHTLAAGGDFAKQVQTHRAALAGTKLAAEAKSAVRLVGAARDASKEEIVKVLKDAKNLRIRPELLDILGYAQTTASHAAVAKVFHMDDASQSGLSERYLWALSFSANPNPEIMEDLLRKFRNTQNIPEKVRETLVSTLASMARNLLALPNYDQRIHNEIQSVIVNYMDAADKRAPYLRALMNLQAPSTIPFLLDIAGSEKQGCTPKDVALAWKAIQLIAQRELAKSNSALAFDTIRIQATRTFLQLRAKEDSTSRTISFDILVMLSARAGANIDEMAAVIVDYLRRRDSDAEVNQYVLQRLRMLFERNSNRQLVLALEQRFKQEPTVFNYHVFSPKGLSVAMAADVYPQGGLNDTIGEGADEHVVDALRGGLGTVQEIQKGFVKRGVVSVTVGRGRDDMELFGLGIFSSGLGGLIGGGDENDGGEAMAGMELSVLGTHLRPFVFFTGQGELMGHVWSGTGSDRTTAFQAILLLHDYQQRIRLGNGLTVTADVKSAASVDLSGRITISLWYRNADAKVEKAAGIFTLGALNLDATFVTSRIEFSASLEPRLELYADVDFSEPVVMLCMRLSQPALDYAYNAYKIERVYGSKHKLRRRVRRRHPLPGRTYALNRKNADMCNAIFRS